MIARILRITLVVRDQEEAFQLYTGKLGFEKRDDRPMGERTRWLTIAPKDDHNLEIVLQPLDWFEGQTRADHAALVGKNPTMVFQVEDCRETYETLLQRGVEFEQPPQERPTVLKPWLKTFMGIRSTCWNPTVGRDLLKRLNRKKCERF